MYGLVNSAIETMVTERFGAETWERIKVEAGVDADQFLALHQYPDASTYDLVSAASRVLGASATEILEAFGEYWISHSAKRGYGDLMRAFGASLPDFLQSLDNLHARLALTIPEMRPPSFQVTERGADSLILHYYSDRPGLGPFVVGLVRGLGKMFKTPVAVEPHLTKAGGADHDSFVVRFAVGG